MEMHGVAQAILVLCGVSALGLMLGQVRIAGVKLGVGGALFAGIAIGHLGIDADPAMLQFAREFGLVLFVYAVGVSIGPGFFEAFRRNGVVLNVMAVSVVLMGTLTAMAVHVFAGVELPAVLGLLSGAVTNTPSLAASQQILSQMEVPGSAITGQAYAVTYPFGIIGILLAMLIVRAVFRLDPLKAAKQFEADRGGDFCAIETLNVEIRNPAVVGCRLRDLDELRDMGIVLSRVLHDGGQRVVQADDVLAEGDVVLAVGTAKKLERLHRLLGPVAGVDLKSMPAGDVTWERMVVTRTDILGRTLGELNLRADHGVVVSRVNRMGQQLIPDSRLSLQFGDILTVVGNPNSMPLVAGIVGNRSIALQETQMAPIFIGITLGMVAGSLPLALPGLPSAVKLGLAGGPLLVAILLSRLGHVGRLVWFMPPAANHALRDLGIALFLAAVGVRAGAGFLDTLIHGGGLAWMGWGAVVTLVPLLVVGLVGWWLTKINYLTLCGVLAGSMTDPPALAFAQGMSLSEAPILAYAAVYPVVMVLRVVAPQIVALMLWAG